MAGDRVGAQQRGVGQKYHRAEPQSEAVGKGKCPDPVDEEDDRERERRIEEVAVNVLEDQREARLTRIAAVRLGYGARRRREPERAVVGLAVVVARKPKPEGERKD